MPDLSVCTIYLRYNLYNKTKKADQEAEGLLSTQNCNNTSNGDKSMKPSTKCSP